jgi:hypothetical protein
LPSFDTQHARQRLAIDGDRHEVVTRGDRRCAATEPESTATTGGRATECLRHKAERTEASTAATLLARPPQQGAERLQEGRVGRCIA